MGLADIAETRGAAAGAACLAAGVDTLFRGGILDHTCRTGLQAFGAYFEESRLALGAVGGGRARLAGFWAFFADSLPLE